MSVTIYPVSGTGTGLPFYISGIGISDPEYHINRTSGLVSHQIMFTMDGKGILKTEGKISEQVKGICTYIPPAAAHEYYPEKSEWKTAWVVFSGETLSQLMLNLGFKGISSSKISDTKTLEHYFRAMLSIADNYSNTEKCSELLYGYILEARRILLRQNSFDSANDALKRAIEYIDHEFEHDIPLSEAARAADLSEQHLCRIFKKSTGMTISEYIARKRIAKAKAMLDDTDIPVNEIGASVGYPDRSYFSSVFRRYEGMSPTEYRNNI